MSKKFKDYYDLEYAYALADKLAPVCPCFDTGTFISLLEPELEQLEFNGRQELIAKALKKCIPLSYHETIEVFSLILGPELTGSLGMFTEGYWLWPVSKYVELFGFKEFRISTGFSKELTKRFTGEYCMRPIIRAYPRESMELLLVWSKDDNKRVRRLSGECIRIRLPWAKKLYVALEYFDTYVKLLSNLKDDPDKTIQKSVANNLNDLYKEDPVRFDSVIALWQDGQTSKECKWIIKHASRTKNKK